MVFSIVGATSSVMLLFLLPASIYLSIVSPVDSPPLTVIDWPLPLSPRLADLLLRALALCHQQPAPPALLLPRSAVGFKRSVVRVALAWPNLP